MEKPAAFPQTLEIETTDFHIPSAPATIANIDIQKPKGAFPSLPTVLLQAHPSIGKNFFHQNLASGESSSPGFPSALLVVVDKLHETTWKFMRHLSQVTVFANYCL
jgi:hypothetical protein